MKIVLFLMGLVSLISTAAAVEAPARLRLVEAVVGEAEKGGSVAVYGLLVNESAVSMTIVRVASPAAGQVLMQRVGRDAKGLATTEILPRLTVPARGAVELVPGLTELRLVGLTDELLAGVELPLLVELEHGQSQVLRLSVVGLKT